MFRIVFIEGISGVGKSTTVRLLSNRLRTEGYRVNYYIEGDPFSPIDLCWTAYLEPAEFQKLLKKYPAYKDTLKHNTIHGGDYYLVRYQIQRDGLYSDELNAYLHKKEFCYNPENPVPLQKFTDVFSELWRGFADDYKYNNNWDFIIFDASLAGHITNDLIRNYNAPADEIIRHIETLTDIITHMDPVVFYLYSDDTRQRLTEARKSRGQEPPDDDKIEFWEHRKLIDLSVLPELNVENHIFDISENNWDFAIDDMISIIT